MQYDNFTPVIQAVIEGRMTGAEAYLACMKDGEEPSEDPPSEPVALDVIGHKFGQPRDAESELRRRRRLGTVSGRDGRDAHRSSESRGAVGFINGQTRQQELRAALEVEPFTWAPSDSSAEIDFLVESTCGIVPIEAKAERNLQEKSLGVYRAKFAPPFAVRTSLADPHEADGLWDIPLWALGSICNRLVLPHKVAERPLEPVALSSAWA